MDQLLEKTLLVHRENSSSTLDNPGQSKAELEWIKICLAAFRSPVIVGCGCGLAQIRETQEGHRRWEKEAVKILS